MADSHDDRIAAGPPHGGSAHGGHASGHGPADHGQHEAQYKAYWAVFIALCVCTALSFVFNLALGQGPLSAMLIGIVAIIKAGLVASIFMHLKYDWKKVAGIMIPVVIMCVMTIIILSIDGALAWHAK